MKAKQEEIPDGIEGKTAALFAAHPPTNQNILLELMKFWKDSDLEGSHSIYLHALKWLDRVEERTDACMVPTGIYDDSQRAFEGIFGYNPHA